MPATKAETDIVAMLALLSDAGELQKRLTTFMELREAAEKSMADSEQAKHDASVEVQKSLEQVSHSKGLIAAHQSTIEKDLAELEAQRQSIAIVTKEILEHKEQLQIREEQIRIREDELNRSAIDLKQAKLKVAEETAKVTVMKADLERRLSHLKEATV